MQNFKTSKNLISSLEGDAEKFYTKANSKRGTRPEKGMQELEKPGSGYQAEFRNLRINEYRILKDLKEG